MSSKVMVEAQPVVKVGNDDPWKEFCIVYVAPYIFSPSGKIDLSSSRFVRTLPKVEDQFHKPTFKVVVKSEYIVKACKDVVQTWPGISWNAEPLEVRDLDSNENRDAIISRVPHSSSTPTCS
jgi:hypothetical protein